MGPNMTFMKRPKINLGPSVKQTRVSDTVYQVSMTSVSRFQRRLFENVFFWRLHFINTLKQELSGTKAYKETSEEVKSVVNGHCNHLALKFSECAKECLDRLPTMYWLPRLHKRPYNANASSCTTTELSKLLTSCLTAVKIHVIRYCENVYERSGKNLFWSIILVRYLMN